MTVTKVTLALREEEEERRRKKKKTKRLLRGGEAAVLSVQPRVGLGGLMEKRAEGGCVTFADCVDVSLDLVAESRRSPPLYPVSDRPGGGVRHS